MMSFVQMTKSEVVKKQYFYKLKAYKGSYSSLMIIQTLGLAFSALATSSMSGSFSGNFSYDFVIYSANMVFAFTLLWAFITGMTITSKNYRYDDFSFVSNRKTSNLSNTLFLLSISVLAGITSVLMGVTFRLLAPLVLSGEILATSYTITDLTVGMTATVFYCVFLSALGYLVGTMVQLNKVFQNVLPLILIGLLIGLPEVLGSLVQFYLMETSLSIFVIKASVPALICFLLAGVMSDRMEVRK
mgnify:FL=1